MPTFMDADEIRAATFVRTVEVHETLGSTNDRAAALARDLTVELPALVVARQQTAGRGRGTNIWQSSDGALTFSLLIDPASFGISTAKWPQVSLATAVAVCDALAEHVGWAQPTTNTDSTDLVGGAHATSPANTQAAQLTIKWPNDVMLCDRKVCGILIESPGGAAPGNKSLIVGVGVNINNRLPPLHIGMGGIALCEVIGQQCRADQVLESFLIAFETRIAQLASRDPLLPRTWQQLSWLHDRSVEVLAGDGRQILGVCAGIDPDGALLIDCTSGRERLFSGSLRGR